MRSLKKINKDIQAAKDGIYFENSQKFISTVACFAITGLLADWAKSTTTAVAGNACGNLAACIVMALGKICSNYVDNGIKSYFFAPLTNKLVIPMLEAEKTQAEEESPFSGLYKIKNRLGL